MKSTRKPNLVIPQPPAPPPSTKTVEEEMELLLTKLGAIQKKIAPIIAQAKPFWDQMDELRKEMSDLTLKAGKGKGATKTIVTHDGTKVRVSPVTHYKMTQEDYQNMLNEFPDDDDSQARAMSVIRWKPELDKKVYNAFTAGDQIKVNKFLVSTEGKPKFEIIRPGEKEEAEE